jgi:hypothetical protein
MDHVNIAYPQNFRSPGTALNIQNRFLATFVNLFINLPYTRTKLHVAFHCSLIIATKRQGFVDYERPPFLHHMPLTSRV